MRRKLGVLGALALAAAFAGGQIILQPDKDGVYNAGRGIASAKLTRTVAAINPSDPDLKGIKHVCAVRLVVGIDGTPGTIEILNEKATPFEDAAVAAVKQSQFQPATYRGKPVPAYELLWVPFNVGKKLGVPMERSAVSNPVPLNLVEAEYPDLARTEKISGVVLVSLLVNENGLPTDPRLISSLGKDFDENAIKAVKKYRFKPATVYGVPVPLEITVEVNFRPSY